MNEQEQKIFELQKHSEVMDAKFEMFMREMSDFKNEMRQQNEMRAKENLELRDLMKEIYTTTDEKFAKINESTDAKISKIESKLDSITSHIQILTMTAMGGIIAAGVGLAAMVYSVLNK